MALDGGADPHSFAATHGFQDRCQSRLTSSSVLCLLYQSVPDAFQDAVEPMLVLSRLVIQLRVAPNEEVKDDKHKDKIDDHKDEPDNSQVPCTPRNIASSVPLRIADAARLKEDFHNSALSFFFTSGWIRTGSTPGCGAPYRT